MLAEAGRDLVQRALAPLAARVPNVRPNVLTACGLGVAVAAALAFARTDDDPAWFLVAAALCLLYGLVDAFDGVLARTRGLTSPLGDFLDHTLDRLSAVIALGGIALAQHANDRIVLVLMVATLWHGFLGTQLEASFGTRIYRGIGIGESLVVGLVYSLTAYGIRASGLPFSFEVPALGVRLSVTDAFALAALPLVIIGTCQRFAIAAALARGKDER